MAASEAIQAVGILVGLGAAAWGFYTGWLPRWMRRQIGFYELKEKVECVERNTNSLKQDHEETINQINSLKAGQIAIAESVANDHDVNAEALRSEHFDGGEVTPHDFIDDSHRELED